MEKLFSENFDSVQNQEEFNKLKEKYSNYHPLYLKISASVFEVKTKNWLEFMFNQYYPYINENDINNFLNEIKSKEKFHKRSWELFLGFVFLNNKFTLKKRDQEGPDFQIVKEEKFIWVEAIAPEQGKGNNKVETFEEILSDIPSETVVSGGGNIDELNEPKILRIRSAISEKINKYNKYIEKNTFKKEDCYVIAINGGSFDGWQMSTNLIMGALFGLGNMYFKINSLNNKSEGPYYQDKTIILNKNLSQVDVDIFRSNKYKNISAVIYNGDSITNNFYNTKNIGNNLITVLNPFARNPLPEGFINFGSLWKLESIEGFKIVKIK